MAKRLNTDAINAIKELRKTGHSLNEINQIVKVGQTSIQRYAKDTVILPQYINAWKRKRLTSVVRKECGLREAAVKASEKVNKLNDKERLLFMAALYWGEGTKRDFCLSNSDPELVQVFIKGLHKLLGKGPEELQVSIRVFEDLDRKECLEFWSKITNVPIKDFRAVDVKKGKKSGNLPHGMCRIRVNKSGDLLKYMVAVKNEVIKLY